MLLSSSVVSKIPYSLDILSTVPQSIAKRTLTANQPHHFLFSKKSQQNNNTFQVNPSPNPSWTLGEQQKILPGKTITIEPSKLQPLQRKQLLLGSFPRPVSVISTISPEGVSNAAAFSFVSLLSVDPPTISITILKNPDGSKKDTEINIDASNEFAVNLVSDWFVESAAATSKVFPSDVSEFEKVGLTAKKATSIKAPLVAQSAVNYECKVSTRIPFVNQEGKETSVCYMGEVVKAHINEDIFDKETFRYNTNVYKPTVKLSGPFYAQVNSVYALKN